MLYRYARKLGTLALLLLATAWLVTDRGWEPLIVFLGFLGGLIGLEILDYRAGARGQPGTAEHTQLSTTSATGSGGKSSPPDEIECQRTSLPPVPLAARAPSPKQTGDSQLAVSQLVQPSSLQSSIPSPLAAHLVSPEALREYLRNEEKALPLAWIPMAPERLTGTADGGPVVPRGARLDVGMRPTAPG